MAQDEEDIADNITVATTLDNGAAELDGRAIDMDKDVFNHDEQE
jgi:hypothetical protein